MPINVGMIDRWIRITLGMALLLLTLSGAIDVVWGWIALIPFLTGVLVFCPLYHLLGWSTHERSEHAHA